jgi:hypothetical protein
MAFVLFWPAAAFGHNPTNIMAALSKEQVMANIMTPNQAQHDFWQKLKRELPGK